MAVRGGRGRGLTRKGLIGFLRAAAWLVSAIQAPAGQAFKVQNFVWFPFSRSQAS